MLQFNLKDCQTRFNNTAKAKSRYMPVTRHISKSKATGRMKVKDAKTSYTRQMLQESWYRTYISGRIAFSIKNIFRDKKNSLCIDKRCNLI